VDKVDHEVVRAVLKLPTKHDWMRKGEDWEAILRKKIEEISKRCSK
jgi:hypothetical protein